MEPVIQSIVIKRFRSIQSERIAFANPTFLVGKNGSGKSNLVDAFVFLADAMTVPLQAVFDRRGGISAVRNRTSGRSYPPNIGMQVVLGPLDPGISRAQYAFEVSASKGYGFVVKQEQCLVIDSEGRRNWFNRERKQFSSSARGLSPSLDASSLGLPLVGGDVRFAPVLKALANMRVTSIEPSKLREMQDPDIGLGLRRDGGNTASVLQEIARSAPEDMTRITEILEAIVPNTKNVRAKKHGNKLSLEFSQQWGTKEKLLFEAFNMSDGTLRALGLIAAVFQRPSPSVLAIEEPEATIHPGAMGAVLDLVRQASKMMQVVVTTHSPDILDAKWIRDTHLRLVEWKEGATRVRTLSDSTRTALREHLMGAGELLRANALQPESLFEDVADPQASLFEDMA